MAVRTVRVLGVLAFGVGLAVAPPLYADVVRITISSRAPLFNGQSFGAAGPYEDIKGVAFGAIDPRDPKNAVITDIELAPKNARGLVEYRTTFTLRKPVDMTRSAGVLLYNIVNRGNHNGPDTWHVGGDPGEGFLYRLGQALLWSGWQGDMPIASVSAAQEGIDVPVGKNADGSALTGRVWARFVNVAGRVTTQLLPGARSRLPATLDTASATLVSVASETSAGVKSGVVTIASADWAFADCQTVPFPGRPDPTRVCLKNGFDSELLYELVYIAKDPYVLGVGMAAMRDVVSFFRYAAADSSGTANPIAGAVPHVVAMGNSQSGRFAKAFVNLGFNQDEHGRIVWDGLNARIAGMLGSFNTRFGQPGDIAELYDPGAEGPLWWTDYLDRVRGRPAWGLLHRCAATRTCPKITETYGGPEIWYSRGSVGIAGTAGTEDLPVPDNVRRYYHPGTPHGGGPGGFNLGAASTTAGVLANNPNPERETDRALYLALVDWVVKNTPPPPSVYPRIGDGTLVPNTSTAMGWPAIPNAPRPDGVVNLVLDYDYGSAFRYNDNSGVIANVPPPIRRVIPTLVPKVDRDGNEIAGVRSLLMRMPLGTYTGWNPIPSGALKGRQRSLAGGYVPFAKTKAERLAAGDPRLSIAERYPSLWSYYSSAVAQAEALVKERFLLPEDAVRLLKQLLSDLEASGLFEK
jgi:Alpha/beta hydrolase domain